jgi:hypothetical protein
LIAEGAASLAESPALPLRTGSQAAQQPATHPKALLMPIAESSQLSIFAQQI